MDMPDRIKIHKSPASENLEGRVAYNTDLQSFLLQLAEDSSERGFEILPRKALNPRYNKRNSAPPAMNGATRRMPDCFVATKSYQLSGSTHSEGKAAVATETPPNNLLVDTVFDDALLQKVMSEVDSILYDDDDLQEDDDIQSQDSHILYDDADDDLEHDMQLRGP